MLKKFLPEKFLMSNNTTITKEKIFETPLIGLYFSALWCPPCVGFHLKLLEFYKTVNTPKKRIEFILCSLDEDEEDFKQYLTKMSFPVIDYSDPKLEDLTAAFGVESIPMIIVFDYKGNLIDTEGKHAVEGKNTINDEETIKSWLKKSNEKNAD